MNLRAGLPPSASDDALDRSGAGSAGDLMVHARAGEDPIAPAPPNMLCRSSAPRIIKCRVL